MTPLGAVRSGSNRRLPRDEAAPRLWLTAAWPWALPDARSAPLDAPFLGHPRRSPKVEAHPLPLTDCVPTPSRRSSGAGHVESLTASQRYLSSGRTRLHMSTAVRIREPRIKTGQEPESCVPRLAGLANPVRWIPAREEVAATDTGPPSGAALQAAKREGVRFHGERLLLSLDQSCPSEFVPHFWPHRHPFERARLVPGSPRTLTLRSGGLWFQRLAGIALAWTPELIRVD